MGWKMTSQQTGTIREFEIETKKRGVSAELDWKESNVPESQGVLFADADGITLVVYSNGLISVPAVRTYHPHKYPTPIMAAAFATVLWAEQRAGTGPIPSWRGHVKQGT
jgi:hypothetical protein